MPQALQNIDLLSLTAGEIAMNLIVALLCGYAVSRFYKWTQQHTGNGKSFTQSLVLLSLITAMVIMIIGDSLARAFGLVGAMSIIRFRTAVKDTADIMYIFFSLGVGLAAGAGAHRIALLGTGGIGVVALILAKYSQGGSGRNEYVLQFTTDGFSEESPQAALMHRFSKSFTMVQMKSVEGGRVSITCSVQLARRQDPAALVDALRAAEGVDEVACFFDDRQY